MTAHTLVARRYPSRWVCARLIAAVRQVVVPCYPSLISIMLLVTPISFRWGDRRMDRRLAADETRWQGHVDDTSTARYVLSILKFKSPFDLLPRDRPRRLLRDNTRACTARTTMRTVESCIRILAPQAMVSVAPRRRFRAAPRCNLTWS